MEETTNENKDEKWDVPFTLWMSRSMRDFLAAEIKGDWNTPSSSMYIRKLIKREMDRKSTIQS